MLFWLLYRIISVYGRGQYGNNEGLVNSYTSDFAGLQFPQIHNPNIATPPKFWIYVHASTSHRCRCCRRRYLPACVCVREWLICSCAYYYSFFLPCFCCGILFFYGFPRVYDIFITFVWPSFFFFHFYLFFWPTNALMSIFLSMWVSSDDERVIGIVKCD